jgi:ABC-type uncharacterized transport system permease subunit
MRVNPGHLRLSRFAPLFLPIAGLAVAISLGSVFIALAGKNPVNAYATIIASIFKSSAGFASLVRWAIPLMILGVAASFSLKAGLWNLGMEGQMYLGALFSTFIGFSLKGCPGFCVTIVGLFVSMAAGFIWALIPALLRAYLSVNEFIVSLLLNFVAVLLSDFFTINIWQDKSMGGQTLSTFNVAESAQFGKILPGSQMHDGLYLALAILIIYWYIMRHSSLGFALKAQGKNPRFIKYGGGSPTRNIIVAMGISGALSGVAGYVEVYGVSGAFFTRMFSGGVAWDGLVVALLGSLQPLGIGISSFLFGFLKVALLRMERFTEVSRAVVTLTQAFIIFFIAMQANILSAKSKRRDRQDE